MALLQSGITKSLAAAAYTIDQSCRFEKTDPSYLSRTFTSEGNLRTWTWSGWVKTGDQLTVNTLFGWVYVSGGTNNQHVVLLNSDGSVSQWKYSLGYIYHKESAALLRDPSAWYHIVSVYDSTNAEGEDRSRLYINGERVTAWATDDDPTLNLDGYINTTVEHGVGAGLPYQTSAGTNQFSGYLAEVYFIDGQALDADDFGETDSTTNQWKPIDSDTVKDAVTFGTNGFYLKFEDSADLGNDSSGEGNDYTPTNLAATDQMPDSPTNNFCTINRLDANSEWTISEGNTKCNKSSAFHSLWRSTMGVDSGKWYWEFLCQDVGVSPYIGCQQSDDAANGWAVWLGNTSSDFSWSNVGYTYDGGVGTADNFTTYSTGDILGFAVDCDGATLKCYKNNVLAGTLSNLIANKIVIPAGSAYFQFPIQVLNFGSDSSFAGAETAQGNADGNGVGDFYYEPPSGYLAICTSNLSAPSIALPGDNFNTVLYTGDGATTLAVTGAGFAPDFTWIKNRDAADKNVLVDSVRGANEYLSCNSNAAEVDDSTFVASLDSDGFTVGDDVVVNTNTENYASWNWLAGGAPTADNDNTSGAMDANSVSLNGSLESAYTPSGSPSIYPTRMSINTTNGQSLVGYVGTDANATIPHGLSQAPELIIVKARDTVGGSNGSWAVGSSELTSWAYTIQLDTTNEQGSDATRFNSTAPTASVFSVGDSVFTNSPIGENYISYCFHSVEGYSKVGKWTGNGSVDGTFIYMGFRPAFLILHRLDLPFDWFVEDNKRLGYNPDNNDLIPNTGGAEETDDRLDIVSNGIKLRLGSTSSNASGGTYLYYAVAAYPFKYAPAR